MEVSIEVEPIEIDGELFIPFPNGLAELVEYEKGDQLVFIADGERLLIQNKRLYESELCDICHESKKKHLCLSCGKRVCSNCYWSIGGLCKQCMSQQRD